MQSKWQQPMSRKAELSILPTRTTCPFEWVDAAQQLYHKGYFDLPMTWMKPLLYISWTRSMLASRYCIAKTGWRLYSSSTSQMDTVLETVFTEAELAESAHNLSIPLLLKKKLPTQICASDTFIRKFHMHWRSFYSKLAMVLSSMFTYKVIPPELRQDGKYQVGSFVYMWVKPMWRGSEYRLGDALLQEGKLFCKSKGDKFMLLVHDDNGSGKLINYYRNRHGFISIENELGLPKAMI